jgi:integrase
MCHKRKHKEGLIIMATKSKRGNSYQFTESCGYNSKGKQIRRTTTWQIPDNLLNNPKALEKEATRQLILFEEDCRQGLAVTTVKKFEVFANEWLEDIVKPDKKQTSYTKLVSCSKRVYSELGHYRIDRITPAIIQDFINGLSKKGANERTGEKLAPKTVKHYLSFISCVFTHAVDMRIIAKSPCKGIKIPKIRKKERLLYSEEELNQFLIALENAPLKYRVFFSLIVHSGARRGEILGLMFKDFNWKKNKVKIERTALYDAELGDYTDTPKTEASRRTLNFSPEVIELVRKLKAEQKAERERLGGKWVDNDRLFTKWNGLPMNYQTPAEWLQGFTQANGLPYYGIHHFRHLFASLLIHRGVSIVKISKMLGHENPTVTLQIYAHEIKEAEEDANDEPFITF